MFQPMHFQVSYFATAVEGFYQILCEAAALNPDVNEDEYDGKLQAMDCDYVISCKPCFTL